MSKEKTQRFHIELKKSREIQFFQEFLKIGKFPLPKEFTELDISTKSPYFTSYNNSLIERFTHCVIIYKITLFLNHQSRISNTFLRHWQKLSFPSKQLSIRRRFPPKLIHRPAGLLEEKSSFRQPKQTTRPVTGRAIKHCRIFEDL